MKRFLWALVSLLSLSACYDDGYAPTYTYTPPVYRPVYVAPVVYRPVVYRPIYTPIYRPIYVPRYRFR